MTQTKGTPWSSMLGLGLTTPPFKNIFC